MIDKLRRIKISRMKPEELFLDNIFKNIIFREQTYYPNSIFWEKDGEIVIEQDFESGMLRVSWDKIWSVFAEKYGYGFNWGDIQTIILRVGVNYIKCDGLKPGFCMDGHLYRWGKI